MHVHVAQINIGTMVAPTDDPAVGEFVDNLDRINADADRAPGFVWRLQTDEGNATSIQIFPDPLQLVNMSVWESPETLKDYVYRTDHAAFFRRRAEWFVPAGKRVALWWVPAGTIPELSDAVRRVAFLERHGASPYAFGFARPPEPMVVERTTLDDPATRELVGRLDAELAATYDDPGANHFTLDPSSVAGDDGMMVRAVVAGRALACGAIRRLDADTAEVKRMYVDPAARGQKLGAALLDQLEQHALRLGYRALALETGIHQQAAIALYEGAGFEPTPLWGEYLRSPDTSRCYRKPL